MSPTSNSETTTRAVVSLKFALTRSRLFVPK